MVIYIPGLIIFAFLETYSGPSLDVIVKMSQQLAEVLNEDIEWISIALSETF